MYDQITSDVQYLLLHTFPLENTLQIMSKHLTESREATFSFLTRVFLVLCSGWLCRVFGGGVGLLVFVVVTALNLICNGYQLVGLFTIANGENKSVFAMFII